MDLDEESTMLEDSVTPSKLVYLCVDITSVRSQQTVSPVIVSIVFRLIKDT